MFEYTNFQRWSNGAEPRGNNLYAYKSATDNLDDITSDGYFDAINGYVNGVPATFTLALYDLIFVSCTDYQGFLQVDANETTLVTSPFPDPVPALDFATRDLNNLQSTAINVSLVPEDNDTLDIGSDVNSWSVMYVQEIANGTIGATQPPNDDSRKLATTEYVDNALSTASPRTMAAIVGNYYLTQIPGLFDAANLTDAASVGYAGQQVSHVSFYPFYLNEATSYDEASILIQTAEAASEITVGVYASNAGFLPTGNPLDTAVLSGASTGASTGAISLVLPAGVYWFAFQCSSAVTLSVRGSLVTSVQAAVTGLGLGLPSTNIAGNSYLGYSQTHTYSSGVLPAVSGAAPSTFNGFCSASFLRAA